MNGMLALAFVSNYSASIHAATQKLDRPLNFKSLKNLAGLTANNFEFAFRN